MRALPPLTALRAYEAAARHLSFKKAAEELCLTPTAISHQIRLLEAHLGEPLFRRLPRPLIMTKVGAALYPSLRDAFGLMASGLLSAMQSRPVGLRVTTTNAFAARCLLPRLSLWHEAFPDAPLGIIGTDSVLDLAAAEADLAIRYARAAPTGSIKEICRDHLLVVASPMLVGAARGLTPAQIRCYPLIEAEWPDWAIDPPIWENWTRAARGLLPDTPDMTSAIRWRFREELHAIEAAISGQGIAICSDVLAHDALADGSLVKVSSITLLGYGFFAVPRPEAERSILVQNFVGWLATVVLQNKNKERFV